MIGIISHGYANVANVCNAVKYLDFAPKIINKPDDMSNTVKLIIPGVGSFGAAMQNLNKTGLTEAIIDEAGKLTPILGICLGMQLMYSESTENGLSKGLGLIPGTVQKMPWCEKLPHIGWNNLEIIDSRSRLFDITNGSNYFYFLHSYHCLPDNKNDIVSLTSYGGTFVSAVQRNNLFGTQFHPEKSHNNGLEILRKFLEL